MITEEMASILKALTDRKVVACSSLRGIEQLDELIHRAKLQGYVVSDYKTVQITQSGIAALNGYGIVQEAKHLTQDELWQRINEVEEAMNDEQSHYGKTPAWRAMNAEHTALWKLATDSGEGAQAVSADASPVVSDAAKIAALEAENAALRGLLVKALDAIAPFAESVSDDDVIAARDNAPLFVDRADGDDVISIRHGVNFETLKIGDLRAAATIAADIRTALDPTTPYENTPDGSDLLARDTEADDDE